MTHSQSFYGIGTILFIFSSPTNNWCYAEGQQMTIHGVEGRQCRTGNHGNTLLIPRLCQRVDKTPAQAPACWTPAWKQAFPICTIWKHIKEKQFWWTFFLQYDIPTWTNRLSPSIYWVHKTLSRQQIPFLQHEVHTIQINHTVFHKN